MVLIFEFQSSQRECIVDQVSHQSNLVNAASTTRASNGGDRAYWVSRPVEQATGDETVGDQDLRALCRLMFNHLSSNNVLSSI
jgi:hypothetical protein